MDQISSLRIKGAFWVNFLNLWEIFNGFGQLNANFVHKVVPFRVHVASMFLSRIKGLVKRFLTGFHTESRP